MSHDTNNLGADLAEDREARRRNATSSFEPISASLDMLEKMNNEHADLVRTQIRNIRSEIKRRISAIAESSITDPTQINIQPIQINGLHYLPCFTDGSAMEPANSAKKHFGGGVFFGRNCPHNAEIQMDDSVRSILAAEMASIARALEIAHLVSVHKLIICYSWLTTYKPFGSLRLFSRGTYTTRAQDSWQAS